MDIPDHLAYIKMGIPRPAIPGIVFHALREHMAHVRGYLQAPENEEIIAFCQPSNIVWGIEGVMFGDTDAV